MFQKINKYKAVFAILLFIQVFKAQVTITVPSGTLHSTGLSHAEWRKPLGTYFGYERSAMIFTHTEIGQYGTINTISFYCDTVNTPGNTPISVYMKEVANSSFASATTVQNEESGAQLVYNGTLSSASFVKGQWAILPLSNPFLHATANSVEVIVETNATGTGNEGSLAKGFYHYVTSIYAFQYWSADNAAPANAGVRSYMRPNIQFDLTPVSGCSGMPNAGTAVSSVDTTCSSVDLSLSGATAATGLVYQWEDSLSGGAWTAIVNANAAVLSTAISANTWFRCKVSCASDSSYSSVKQVVIRNYLECYCNINLGGGCNSSAIDSVAIETTTLANGLSGCSANNYIQYPATGNTAAQLASGQSYNLHTRFNGVVIASVWVDYDQNGQFDSLEWKQIVTTAKIDSDYVTVLSVPANAKTGLTLMRIRSRATGNSNSFADACTNFGSGETEDYFIGVNYDVSKPEIQKAGLELVLYPNPASEGLSIYGHFMPGEKVAIDIYTTDGSFVSENAVIFNGRPLYADISKLGSGVYFVSVSTKGQRAVKKLLVNH